MGVSLLKTRSRKKRVNFTSPAGCNTGREIIYHINVNVVTQIRYPSAERACYSLPVGEYPAGDLE